jgi:hypothetical protein
VQAQRVRLTLGHDRRWSFALAGLSAGSKAQDREDHCGSNGDFLHNAPNFPLTWIVQSKTWTVQNKKDELAPLVQKSHSLQSICGRCYDSQFKCLDDAIRYSPFDRDLRASFTAGLETVLALDRPGALVSA